MNYLEHPYPEDLNSLMEKARAFKEEVLQNISSAHTLGELYTTKEDKDSLFRNEELFPYFELNSRLVAKAANKNELKGIYVFIENETPVYVGTSRTIFRRLRQHGWGTKQGQCSLACTIAQDILYGTEFLNEKLHIPHAELTEAKEKVQDFKVCLMPVDEDYDLYFLEVALAGLLKTKWNNFRTQ